MPQYNGKDIVGMTDVELVSASFAFEKLLNKSLERRDHPRYKEKFKNQPPPTINPAFVELREEIKREIERRKINNE